MRRLITVLVAITLWLVCGSKGSAASLMGRWKLDTDASDTSGNGNHGTIVGSLSFADGYAHFDGAEDTNYIEIPGSSSWDLASGFTLRAWVKYTDAQPGRGTAIISKHTSGVTSGYGLMVQSPDYDNQLGLMAQPGEAPPDRIYGGTYGDGNWHDVVGVYDGTALSLYVDRQLKARNDSWDYSSFNNVNVRIGYFFPGDDNHTFLGGIDEVRISAGAVPIGPVRSPVNGHYYEVVDARSQIDWTTANDRAEADSYLGIPGHLAKINSAAIGDWITENLLQPAQGYEYAAGGTHLPLFGGPAEGWQWLDGEPFSYTNWASWPTQEPNDVDGVEDGEEDRLIVFGGGYYDLPSNVGKWVDFGESGESVRYLDGYVVEFVPEPSTLVLLSVAAISLLGYAWRRRKRTA